MSPSDTLGAVLLISGAMALILIPQSRSWLERKIPKLAEKKFRKYTLIYLSLALCAGLFASLGSKPSNDQYKGEAPTAQKISSRSDAVAVCSSFIALLHPERRKANEPLNCESNDDLGFASLELSRPKISINFYSDRVVFMEKGGYSWAWSLQQELAFSDTFASAMKALKFDNPPNMVRTTSIILASGNEDFKPIDSLSQYRYEYDCVNGYLIEVRVVDITPHNLIILKNTGSLPEGPAWTLSLGLKRGCEKHSLANG